MTTHNYAQDFYAEPETSYLNCAYHGAIPNVAVEAMNEAAALKQAPYKLLDVAHFEFPKAYRAALAAVLGGDEKQIVIGDSATHGIMLMVQGLHWQAGDEVVISDAEFPANRFPWQSLQQKGVVVRMVSMKGSDWLTNIQQAITPRTRVVGLSWVSYSTGFRLDLGAASRLCRDNGVKLVIDASQGVGGLPFNVKEVPFDLLTCATYKWLMGPYGLGFSYIGHDLLSELSTPNIHWMRVKGAEDFNRLNDVDLDLVEDASRFDVNETANFFNLAAGTASLRYLQGIGIAQVAAHDAALMQQLLDGLSGGFKVMSDITPEHRSNILCLRGDNETHTQEVFARLREARVFTSLRDGNLRISPHIYNTADDIDRLLRVLGSRS